MSFPLSIKILFSNIFMKTVVMKIKISKAIPSFFIKDKIIHSKNVIKKNILLSSSSNPEKKILKKQNPTVTKYKATAPSKPPRNKWVPIKNINSESKIIYFLSDIYEDKNIIGGK